MRDGAILGFVIGIVVMFQGQVAAGMVIWALGIPAGFAMKIHARSSADAMRHADCGSTCPAVVYEGWHGSVKSFYFHQDHYALEFMRANRSKLVNVSIAHQRLLDSADQKEDARADLDVPALDSGDVQPLALGGADEHEVLLDWTRKIETAGGPSARRVALSGGLAAIASPSLRSLLVTEAARIEVAKSLRKAGKQSDGLERGRVLSTARDRLLEMGAELPEAESTRLLAQLKAAEGELPVTRGTGPGGTPTD